MRKYERSDLYIALALIILAVSLRVMPHPANFAPVAAVAIFGGAVLPKRLAIITPLAAMIVSDLVIGLHNLILVTWGCYMLIALASYLTLKRPNFKKVATVTLSGSLFFFIVTNFAVWIASGMYAHTMSGLIECFTLALPFFRSTLLSDVVYTAGLFGVYAFGKQMVAAHGHKQNTVA